MVNMERSRWLSHDYTSEAIYSGEHSIIYANLFQGKQACTVSRVVVGKSMNKTAVFSGQMNQIVFSPY
jgi:murein L,D-transpeptidase YcbB/YkuD